jgi:hypothetical protein
VFTIKIKFFWVNPINGDFWLQIGFREQPIRIIGVIIRFSHSQNIIRRFTMLGNVLSWIFLTFPLQLPFETAGSHGLDAAISWTIFLCMMFMVVSLLGQVSSANLDLLAGMGITIVFALIILVLGVLKLFYLLVVIFWLLPAIVRPVRAVTQHLVTSWATNK